MAKDIIISEALEAKRIGQDLIPQYHGDLLNARILYLFTTAKRKKCDRIRLASAKKFSPLERYLSSRHFDDVDEPDVNAGADFLMLIDVKEWQTLQQRQRIALVDHELCHCGRFEKIVKHSLVGYWVIRGHDVEEFSDVIARHGLWRADVEVMAKVIQQRLPLEPPAR